MDGVDAVSDEGVRETGSRSIDDPSSGVLYPGRRITHAAVQYHATRKRRDEGETMGRKREYHPYGR